MRLLLLLQPLLLQLRFSHHLKWSRKARASRKSGENFYLIFYNFLHRTDQKAAPAIVLETPPMEEMKQPKQPAAPTKLRGGPQIVVDDVRTQQQENMPPGHRPPSPQLSPILPDHVDGSEIEEIRFFEGND